jgi:hypothetical protein
LLFGEDNNMSIDWNDPGARFALIGQVGPHRYNELHAEHLRRSTVANHGRLCGTLRARGHDVGAILISEGFARPFVCGPQSCPPQLGWCVQLERIRGGGQHRLPNA